MSAIYLALDLPLQLLFPILPTPERLLQWALSSSILILLVLALQAILKTKVSCRVRYALWALVLVRLLLPFQLPFSLPVSPAQAVPETPSAWESPSVPMFPLSSYDFEDAHPYHQHVEPGYLGPTAWSQGYIERSEDGETMTSYWDMYSVNQIVQCVWLGGFLLASLLLLISNLLFRMKLEENRTPLEIPDCPLSVYVTKGLPSPCLVGLHRPDIYLTPQTAQDDQTRHHVLAHELTHYAHKDHIWSFLRCLCLAFHWYNPLVWLAVHRSKRDGELACDEGAVARLGEDQRLSYGRTLVDIVARRPARPADLLSCSTTMTEGKKTIQQRIQLLVKHPETRKAALFLAVAVLALAAVFVFAGRSEDTDYYAQFRKDLACAQSIQVGQPPISSLAAPSPITDSALVKQAVERLDDARDLLTPVEENLSDAVLFASSVTLTDGSGRESVYYLYEVNGICYAGLFTDLGEWPDGTFTPFATLPKEVLNQLTELARQQSALTGSLQATDLTAEELAWFSETWLAGEAAHPNIRCQFLTSLYDKPEDIDLYELFYLGSLLPDAPPLTEEERAAVVQHTGDPDCTLTKVTRDEMNQVLQIYAGLKLEQTNGVGLDGLVYLEEYDTYYHWHGDTNYYGSPTFDSGVRAGDRVSLYYGDRVLTLKQNGDDYLFYSNQMVSSVDDAGLSAEGMTFLCGSDDFEVVAATFGTALAQAYLDQPMDRISAVTSARLMSFTITDYVEGDSNQFCVQVDLAVIPVEFNNIYWAAGAGLDAMEGDEWRHTLFYRLVRESKDRWRCDEAGTHMGLDLEYSTVYSVTFPEFKARLTELFLNDPEMVALNAPTPEGEAEMRSWLTNWTSAYEICYGLPWWVFPGETEAGWFGRAIDAGSWFFLRIPDHLVESVLAVCEEQLTYLPLSELDLTQYDKVTCSTSSTSVTVPALQASVLEELIQITQPLTLPARIDMSNRDAVIAFEKDGMKCGYLNLQETEQGCLYAIYLPRYAPDTLAAEGILPAGTAQELVDTFHLLADGPDYSTLTSQQAVAALRPSDLMRPFYLGGPESAGWYETWEYPWLVEALQNADSTPVETELNPGMSEFIDYDLWSLELTLPYDCELTLRAGRVENKVTLTLTSRNPDGSQSLNGPKLMLQSKELYELLRHAADDKNQITVTDPAVLAFIDEILSDKLTYYREQERHPFLSSDPYLDIRLTSLSHIAALDGSESGTRLNVYLYDFGLVMDDLVNAPWAGGPYVDGDLLYHPAGMSQHLITLEQNGQLQTYTLASNEFPLSVSYYRDLHGDDAFTALQTQLERLLELDS